MNLALWITISFAILCVGVAINRLMPAARFPAPWTVEEYRGISYIGANADKRHNGSASAVPAMSCPSASMPPWPKGEPP
jgi:hypothetical protein